MRSLRYSGVFGDTGGLERPLFSASMGESDDLDKGVPGRAHR